jgi:hypothetical protein
LELITKSDPSATLISLIAPEFAERQRHIGQNTKKIIIFMSSLNFAFRKIRSKEVNSPECFYINKKRHLDMLDHCKWRKTMGNEVKMFKSIQLR